MDIRGMKQNINWITLAALIALLIVVPGSRSQVTNATTVDNSTATNNITENSTSVANITDNSTIVTNSTDNSTIVNNSTDNSTSVNNSTDSSTNVTMNPTPTTPGMVSDYSTSQNLTTEASPTNSTNNSSMDGGNQTLPNNYTTGGPTVAPTTIAPTTTTTAAPVADTPHNTETSVFTFELTVGPDNSSDIQYDHPNITREELLAELAMFFPNLTTKLVNSTSSKASPGTYILKVEFEVMKYFNKSDTVLAMLVAAIEHINNSTNFTVSNTTATEAAAASFTSALSNVCQASGVCDLGFVCFSGGCEHMCRLENCNHHGTCYTSVLQNRSVTTLCQCDSSYETEYLGDKCQYSRQGRLQIIAIIAGVLGAACLVFIIIIIILCIKFRRPGVSANYNLSGSSYANNAYDYREK